MLPPPAAQPRRRRHRSRTALAVALGVAAIAGGVFAGTFRSGGVVQPSPSTPPGRVIVAINDAARATPAPHPAIVTGTR